MIKIVPILAHLNSLIALRLYSKLVCFEGSFIEGAIRCNSCYEFIPHFKYFLRCKERWSNADRALKRILAPVPTDTVEAWEAWRQFRGAQAEITSIFLIEEYLSGMVAGLEVTRSGIVGSKSCDIHARFNCGIESYLEVKAQSGQQYGDKHPFSDGQIGFAPQFEEDLRNWLFEETVSSRTGEPMTPLCSQASEKGADILIAMTDIFVQKTTDMRSLGIWLVPDHGELLSRNFPRKGFRRWLPLKSASMRVSMIEAGDETSKKMRGVKEVWIFDNARLSEMVVIYSKEWSPVKP